MVQRQGLREGEQYRWGGGDRVCSDGLMPSTQKD